MDDRKGIHLWRYTSLIAAQPLFIYLFIYIFLNFFFLGESANAVPHYHKLCSRVSHIWGNRRGQHIRSAMDKPRPGKTTFVIMVSPLPGKFSLYLNEALMTETKEPFLSINSHGLFRSAFGNSLAFNCVHKYLNYKNGNLYYSY